jgi:hypothetical protein
MHSYMAEITKILGQGSPGQVVETEHEKVLGDAWPNHAPRTSPTMGIVHTTHPHLSAYKSASLTLFAACNIMIAKQHDEYIRAPTVPFSCIDENPRSDNCHPKLSVHVGRCANGRINAHTGVESPPRLGGDIEQVHDRFCCKSQVCHKGRSYERPNFKQN